MICTAPRADWKIPLSCPKVPDANPCRCQGLIGWKGSRQERKPWLVAVYAPHFAPVGVISLPRNGGGYRRDQHRPRPASLCRELGIDTLTVKDRLRAETDHRAGSEASSVALSFVGEEPS